MAKPRVFATRWALGNLVTLIIVFFIYLYADTQAKIVGSNFGWGILAFITKWYLIISIAFLALTILIPLLIILIAIIISFRQFSKARKKKKDYLDIDYEVKE
ncbi:MAG: hypothetical protein AABX51_08190 [Nanoarchaeota archaeon]